MNKQILIQQILEYAFSDCIKDTGTDKVGDNFVGRYCLIRTYSAGVHAGTVVSRNGKEVVLSDSRRIWRWEGASSLSELAVRGTAAPEKCRFPCNVELLLLTEAIEIIPCTAAARKSIEGVPEWSAHQ